MRRPLDEPVRITGDRASHAEYGVGPATDYGCDIGTPVYAPFSGRLSIYITDAGGLGVILWGTDAAFYGQHLWVRMTPGDYSEGDRIALSGNTGSQTTGPHLHCYVIIHATGERLSMEEYLDRASVAGGGARPFPPAPIPLLEDDMMTIHAPNRGIAIIGPGYYKSLTPEEAENSAAIVTKQISGNDRQFDLWRQMAIGGNS